jgi:hypothetical protein
VPATAVPSLVAYCTVASLPNGALIVTVNTAIWGKQLASDTTMSEIDRFGSAPVAPAAALALIDVKSAASLTDVLKLDMAHLCSRPLRADAAASRAETTHRTTTSR